MSRRIFVKMPQELLDSLDGDDYEESFRGGVGQHDVPEPEANIITSLCEDGTHRPALDLDFPCELIPSSTPGHFHLLIDKPMTETQYSYLLMVMEEVGLIQRGFRRRMDVDGFTALRWGVRKPTKTSEPQEGVPF